MIIAGHEIKWVWIERSIYIISLLGTLYITQRDKAVKEALHKQEMEFMKTQFQSQIQDIAKWSDEEKAKWNTYLEWHGKIDMFVTLYSQRGH